MSTIAREFTKEQLQQIIETDHVQCGEASALARIALASLEAEPVCFIDQSNLDYLKSGSDADVWPASRTEMGDVLLYRAAPPAPVSVPDEVCWEDVPEEITEDDMALASAWAHGFNQCRAAMLKHSEPFIVTSDHRMMEMPQVEAINAVTAMLQGVENAETPTTMQTAPALDSSPKIAELPSGNSPVIPDGWVMVPVDMPHEMMRAVQVNSELGAYAATNLNGAYSLFREFWDVAVTAAPQQEMNT
ncbi:DUF551 domain-containing protein [Enterobacter kobei]|uniref:DUF551 domain-containing protein n=1 Tax=Enterobacter kobei TaxID=208224 RepID=UPI002FD298C3